MGKRRERGDNEPKVYSHIYYSKTSKNLMWYIFAPSSFTSHLSWTVSSYRQNSFINFWLRDITPSHITSLDVTPSEVQTLEVFNFWTLNLWEVTPSGSFTFGILHLRKLHLQMFHLRDITSSGHYNFAKLHLPQFLKTSEGEKSKGVTSRRWNFRRCNCPKLKHPEGETSRRCNIQKVKFPKV